LTTATKVQASNIIITSGLGGIYPKGLPIGKVKEVKHEQYDVSLSAIIEPFVDVKTVHDVFIITKFEGQGEVLSSSTFSSGSSSSTGSSSSSSASSKSGSSAASASTGG
jgi:rod shape-determining protein MreC